MAPETLLLLAGLSSSGLPKIPRSVSPTEALLRSCELQEAGDLEGAIQVLRLANDGAELTPSTTIPPEN